MLLVGIILNQNLQTTSSLLPETILKQQENDLAKNIWYSYIQHYGLREVWIIHPPNRADLNPDTIGIYNYSLLPYRVAYGFDSRTLRNETQAKLVSRTYSDKTVWLLEDHLGDIRNVEVLDIYGGWQSHLNCWERIVAYWFSTKKDMPVLILEDDIQFTPDLLVELKGILQTVPHDWSILSLEQDQFCDCTQRFCLAKESRIGGAYILANVSIAQSLYNLNNHHKPRIEIDSSGNIIGWQPLFNQRHVVYCVRGTSCIKKWRRYTRYPHDKRFTPL